MDAFADRRDAGRELASKLSRYAGRSDVVVLALPRGGVPVGHEVARALGAELDVFLVRKLGLPGQPEYAMGAIASGGVLVLNDDALRWHHVPPEAIDTVIRNEQQELARRQAQYREGRPSADVHGRVVILVDDGLATGSTMRAAVAAVKKLEPSKVVVAAPVAAPATCQEFREIVDEVVCVHTPDPFTAVGLWYRDFSQTTDEEVRSLLRASANPRPIQKDGPYDT